MTDDTDAAGNGYGYRERIDPPARQVPWGTPDDRVTAPPASEPRLASVGIDRAITGFDDVSGLLAPSASDALGRLVQVFFAKGLAADPDDLDSIPDGAIYGKAVLTALLGGLIDFAGPGVVNKYAEYLLREPGGAELVTILSQLTDLGHAGAGFEDAAGRALQLFLAKGLASDPDSFDGLDDGAVYRKRLPQLTIGLALASTTDTSVTVLVVGVDPYGGTPSLSWSPETGVTDNGDDTYTIARAAPGAGPRRVVFTATLTNRLDAVEAIDVPEQSGSGPDLDVVATPGATNYSIVWGGDGVELSIDGSSYSAPPTSPISVARNAGGGAWKEYRFRATQSGQTVTDGVSVPPLDADTITPNLTVIPATPGSSSQQFTVTASNPSPASHTIVINATVRGSTGSVPGQTIPNGGTIAIGNGEVVTVQRPAVGSAPATVEFSATLSGGGRETIQRTVLPRGFGPTITVTPTELATTVSIAWDANGTVDYRIDSGSWTSPPASPFTVSRDSAGGDAKTVEVRATLDGQTISQYVVVRPQDGGGSGGGSLTVNSFYWDGTQNNATDTIPLAWAISGEGADSCTVDITYSHDGSWYAGAVTHTNVGDAVDSLDLALDGIDLVNKGTGGYETITLNLTLKAKIAGVVRATAKESAVLWAKQGIA